MKKQMIDDLVNRLSIPKQYGSAWKNSVHPAYQRTRGRSTINRENTASDFYQGRPESRNGRPISRNNSSVERERSISLNKTATNLLNRVTSRQESPSKLTEISIPRHDSPINRIVRPQSRQESPVCKVENSVVRIPRPASQCGNRPQSRNERSMRQRNDRLRESL